MADDDDGSSADFIEPGSDETTLDPRPAAAGVSSDYGSLLHNESLLGSVTSSVYEVHYEQGRYVVVPSSPGRTSLTQFQGATTPCGRPSTPSPTTRRSSRGNTFDISSSRSSSTGGCTSPRSATTRRGLRTSAPASGTGR